MSLLNTRKDYTRKNIILDSIGVEAGYVNDPDDHGGATNLGITRATANRHRKALYEKFGWSGNMRDITIPMAEYIYVIDYWNDMDLDNVVSISPFVANALFKMGINMGTYYPVRWLQESLNHLNKEGSYFADMATDGIMGPTTESSLDKFMDDRPWDGEENVIFTLTSSASIRYMDITESDDSQETFSSGWQNRIREDYNLMLKAM